MTETNNTRLSRWASRNIAQTALARELHEASLEVSDGTRPIAEYDTDGIAERLFCYQSDWLEEHEENVQRDTVAQLLTFLKSSDSTTLAGRGGAYELLKDWSPR